MTYTPGPWKIVRAVISAEDYAIVAGGIIAEVFHRIDDDAFADAEANAHLIAAAPDLLELLKEWLKTPYFETFEEWKNWVGDYGPRVEQALAQVEGKADG